ncbi:MAG: MBL fold metallo-hydrolase [Dehalococcoidales bacterium]|nr:MBL fold metallo-hydrolase [Dehalococcoidales bacterium]
MLLAKLELGMYGTNCYIVGCDKTKEGMVIDPGAEAEAILRTINKGGLTIKLIAITHGHMDHTGAVEDVRRATGASVAIHSSDADSLLRVLPSDRLLNGGENLIVGDLSFSVITTPGHSPGGICLYGQRTLFCGDTLFNGSIGRTDLGGNYEQLMENIFTKLMVLPDDTMVFPGHGPETTIRAEKQSNPFLRMK